jgi:hypothetical protein
MSEPAMQELISAINHNADLLEQHLTEGVYVHHQNEPSKSNARRGTKMMVPIFS